MEDVTVIGSGPCGAMAALELNRRGIGCEVISDQRKKPCGGIIPLKLQNRFPFVKQNADAYRGRIDPVAQAESGGTKVDIPSILMVIDKSRFYDFLMRRLRQEGVPVIKDTILGVRADGLVGKNRTYRTQFVFDASGARGPLKHNYVLDRCYAYRKVMRVPPRRIEELDVELFMDFDLPSGANGYTWLFFGKDFANVGVFVLEGKLTTPQMEALMGDIVRKNVPFPLGRVEEVGGALVPKPGFYPVVDGKYATGGDAAGLASWVGEGTYYAMVSGLAFASTFPDTNEYQRRVVRLQKHLVRGLDLMRIPLRHKLVRKWAFSLFPGIIQKGLIKSVGDDPYPY